MNATTQSLAAEACQACRPGSPRVSRGDADELLTALPGWEIVAVDGIDTLTAAFSFDTFRAALAFANRVGDLADAADHHPELVVEWGRTRVRWWTHTISGLHRNDFIMAARTSVAATMDDHRDG